MEFYAVLRAYEIRDLWTKHETQKERKKKTFSEREHWDGRPLHTPHTDTPIHADALTDEPEPEPDEPHSLNWWGKNSCALWQ